ncbi:hypothetical protein HMPREF0308_0367 [Corynebacterium striatum ATCC 6940]|nr:hypothetical protein HMPREF0308_0367 [Corynebacterium striatum ATCC 6940]
MENHELSTIYRFPHFYTRITRMLLSRLMPYRSYKKPQPPRARLGSWGLKKLLYSEHR